MPIRFSQFLNEPNANVISLVSKATFVKPALLKALAPTCSTFEKSNVAKAVHLVNADEPTSFTPTIEHVDKAAQSINV